MRETGYKSGGSCVWVGGGGVGVNLYIHKPEEVLHAMVGVLKLVALCAEELSSFLSGRRVPDQSDNEETRYHCRGGEHYHCSNNLRPTGILQLDLLKLIERKNFLFLASLCYCGYQSTPLFLQENINTHLTSLPSYLPKKDQMFIEKPKEGPIA